jgi:hypothetical protein
LIILRNVTSMSWNFDVVDTQNDLHVYSWHSKLQGPLLIAVHTGTDKLSDKLWTNFALLFENTSSVSNVFSSLLVSQVRHVICTKFTLINKNGPYKLYTYSTFVQKSSVCVRYIFLYLQHLKINSPKLYIGFDLLVSGLRRAAIIQRSRSDAILVVVVASLWSPPSSRSSSSSVFVFVVMLAIIIAHVG